MARTGAGRVEWFVEERVHDRPGEIGVAGVARAARGVGDLALAGGELGADRHEGRGDIGHAGVEFQAPGTDHVLGLQHHLRLERDGIVESLGKPAFGGDQLIDAAAGARGVDPHERHMIFVDQVEDGLCLALEVEPLQSALFQDAELATRRCRRGDRHQRRVVAGRTFLRVVPDPNLAGIGAQGIGIEVGVPGVPTVDHATAHQLEREHRLRIVNELAHEQIGEFVG